MSGAYLAGQHVLLVQALVGLAVLVLDHGLRAREAMVNVSHANGLHVGDGGGLGGQDPDARDTAQLEQNLQEVAKAGDRGERSVPAQKQEQLN